MDVDARELGQAVDDFAERRVLVAQQDGRLQAALDFELALGAAGLALAALAILDERVPALLIVDQRIGVAHVGVARGFDVVELAPIAFFAGVGRLLIHHRAADELRVLPDLLGHRLVRRDLDQPAGDDFHLGVPLLVAEPVELVDQLGNLFLDLEFDFAVAVRLRRARPGFLRRARFRRCGP